MVCLCTAGAQKESAQWPVFLELLPLMRCTLLQIQFIGPDITDQRDTTTHSFSLQLDTAVQQCPAESIPESGHVGSNLTFQSLWPKGNFAHFSHDQSHTGNGSGLTRQNAADSCYAVPLGKAQEHQDLHHDSTPTFPEDIPSDCCLQLSFHSGCYHEVAAALIKANGRPDLVFGANAGMSD